MNLWVNLLLNKGDLLTEIEAFVLPFSRNNLQNVLVFRDELVSNFGILPCFIRENLYFFSISSNSDVEGFKEFINGGLDRYLVPGVIVFQSLSEQKLVVSENLWRTTIPFLLDYSFRKGVEENSKALVEFFQRRTTVEGRRIMKRIMYLSNPKVYDDQLGVSFHEGFEYRFVRLNENNFCILLDYKLYSSKSIPNSSVDQNVFLKNSSERRNLSEQLLHRIFPESGINLTLGNLYFLLIPQFYEQRIELTEEEV